MIKTLGPITLLTPPPLSPAVRVCRCARESAGHVRSAGVSSDTAVRVSEDGTMAEAVLARVRAHEANDGTAGRLVADFAQVGREHCSCVRVLPMGALLRKTALPCVSTARVSGHCLGGMRALPWRHCRM